MSKIKLMSKGMNKFTGNLGTVAFENGVSVEMPSQAETNRLAAITKIEVIDDEGASQGQAGLGVGMAAGRGVGIANAAHSERGEREPSQVEKNAADVQVGGTEPAKDDVDDAERALNEMVNEAEQGAEGGASTEGEEGEDRKVYTADELAEIADAEGIQGLRKIANPLNVKDNSIAGLIKEILNAQGSK